MDRSGGGARVEGLNDPASLVPDGLGAAIRHRLPGDGTAPPPFLSSSVPDWEALVRAAGRHRVTPLIARGVAAWGPHAPPAAREALAAAARAAATEALAAIEALQALFAALAGEGIPAIAWKGPALALQAWDDPAARTFSDLDVVVERADRERARRVLLALRWHDRWAMTPAQRRAILETQGAWEFTRDASPGLLELHWAFSARRFPGRLPVRDVLSRSVRVRTGRVELPVPAPADALMLLAQHGTKHGWSTVEDVAVFAAMLARHPAAAATAWERACAAGGARAFLLGCALAGDALGVAPPEALHGAIAGDRALPALVAAVHARWASDEGAWRPTLRWDLATTARATDRARLLWHSLVDPTLQEWRAVELPDALLPLYRVVRPARLAARALGVRR